MKTYLLHYARETQLKTYAQTLTPHEDERIADLFKGGVLSSFIMDRDHNLVWLILSVPSKLDVLELIASFQYMRPNDVEIHEVHA